MDFNSSQDANSLITLNPVTAVPYLVLVWLYASHKIWVGSVRARWKEVFYHLGLKPITEEIHVDSVIHNLGGLPLHLFNELHKGLLELGRHRWGLMAPCYCAVLPNMRSLLVEGLSVAHKQICNHLKPQQDKGQFIGVISFLAYGS